MSLSEFRKEPVLRVLEVEFDIFREDELINYSDAFRTRSYWRKIAETRLYLEEASARILLNTFGSFAASSESILRLSSILAFLRSFINLL